MVLAVAVAIAVTTAVAAAMAAVLVVEEAVHLRKLVTVVADLDAVHAHPTLASHVKTRATARVMVRASHGKPMHRASATRKRRVNTASSSARTRAARA